MAEVAAERRVTFNEDDHPTYSPASPEGTRPPMAKKKSSLKTSGSGKKRAGGSVSFYETVTVRELPSEEADEAKETRRGIWEAAPEHDELWDGHSKDFWQEEKTIEEVRRIVVVRGMRMALHYNLGYAFYSMVANFKKRRTSLEDPGPSLLHGDGDVIPEYETPLAEETAIRKEIRELFADSVKGLDFPDLVQDREAFEKLYATTVVNISEARRVPGLGLLRVEELVDEIMNTEEICRMLGVEYVEKEKPAQDQAELEAQEKIHNAVDIEEKRRTDRRASIEAQNSGIPPYGERRASIEGRRTPPMGNSPVQPQTLGSTTGNEEQQPVRRPSLDSTLAGERRGSVQQHQLNPDVRRNSVEVQRRPSYNDERRPSIEPSNDSQRRASIQQQAETQRRGSIQQPVDAQRRGSIQQQSGPQRRASLEAPRRASLVQQPAIDDDDDQPIFASHGRTAIRQSQPLPSKSRNEESPSKLSLPRVLLGLILLFFLTIQRSFHVDIPEERRLSRAKQDEPRTIPRGGGAGVVIVPLLIVTLASLATSKSFPFP